MFAARRLFRLRRANAAPDVLLVFDYLIAKFAVDVNGQIVASVGINEIEADFPFRSVRKCDIDVLTPIVTDGCQCGSKDSAS